MARFWSKWSLLHIFTLVLVFHEYTGCDGRTLRRVNVDTAAAAEVFHMPSLFLHRRLLQTETYCVANANVNETQLQAALNWACAIGQGNVDCSSIQEGGSCYNPNTIVAHATFAFNSYYIAQNGASTACDFNGLASISTTNPSSGSCVYKAFTGTGTPTTPTSPTTPTPIVPATPSSPQTPLATPPLNDQTFSPPSSDNSTMGNANSSPQTSAFSSPLHALFSGFIVVVLLS
ncbi:hypothetical protein KP509_27G008500 [Ceratopteris richardii]|uniref:X8 domain-containing protein n=1 Tax=Ceratopteris richardii TaxID=49495 RepID=A0A8T2RFS4_CERRI|nr:hypothetical protein KP509_27G008500 [Ceratopteris richardii]